MDGRWKTGRHHKRRRDEIQYDLISVGIENRSESLGMVEIYIGIQGSQRRRRTGRLIGRRSAIYFELRSYDLSGR
jgi:hypothetical protein